MGLLCQITKHVHVPERSAGRVQRVVKRNVQKDCHIALSHRPLHTLKTPLGSSQANRQRGQPRPEGTQQRRPRSRIDRLSPQEPEQTHQAATYASALALEGSKESAQRRSALFVFLHSIPDAKRYCLLIQHLGDNLRCNGKKTFALNPPL